MGARASHACNKESPVRYWGIILILLFYKLTCGRKDIKLLFQSEKYLFYNVIQFSHTELFINIV